MLSEVREGVDATRAVPCELLRREPVDIARMFSAVLAVRGVRQASSSLFGSGELVGRGRDGVVGQLRADAVGSRQERLPCPSLTGESCS